MADKTELDYLADIARWNRLAALPGIRARSQELLEPTRSDARMQRWTARRA